MLLSVFTRIILKTYIATGIMLHSMQSVKAMKFMNAKAPVMPAGKMRLSLNK